MPSLRPALHEILEAIAVGSDLQEVARMLCLQAEALVEGSVCSLVTVDREGFLHPLAAPSMPEAAFAAIGSLLIGPAAGSCGTAAFRGEEVVVEEIMTDPVWRDHRAVVLPLGLKASWSIPIKAEDGRVVASLGLYRNSAGAPSQAAREIVATCIHLFQIAFRQQETQARIERLAYRDMLTNLPNRLSFELRAAEALAEPGNTSVCIHYLDLHDFKTVNDTVGHWVGDLLLAEVGRRLESVGGGEMFVSRLGGDEFAVLSRASTDAQQERIADTLLAVFGAPFDVAGYHLRIGASIGSAIATRTDDDLQQLLRNADLARHEAKSFGHARRLFSEEMAETFHRRAFLKAELSAALDRGQFRVEYQPIVDLEKGSVASFEALVRWHHPDLGRVPPDHFIPVAEEMGLISEIGLFVLRQALTDAAHWPPNVAVAVNVSPLQLKGPNFPLHVAAALGAAGVASCRLILEVTETALFDRDAVTWQCIDDLVALGCSIALDDFGTGYSSLSHLRDRRFSKIKIDKSFVGGLGTDTDCEAIVEGTLHFARRQGKRTTAEGIETPLQMAWLVRQGCENGQGYLFSRPMPAAQADAYLATAEQTIAHARAGADVSASALPDWSTPKKRLSQ